MTISWTTLSFSILGPRSRSQWLVLEKHIVITLAPLFNEPVLILYHTNVLYNNILDKFEFERSRAKVKVTVAIFRKTLSSL